MSHPIYVGGWARYREECNVTKKEPLEDFSWIQSGRADYEDCRDALNRVEGGREYLKNYVAVKGMNFMDKIGQQIILHDGHSGASYSCMLWCYKKLLNDWDGWVLAYKESIAYRAYEALQMPKEEIYMIMKNAHVGKLEFDRPCDPGEVGGVVAHIHAEFQEREAKLALEQNERRHRDVIGDLEFKYEHPIRWFDSPEGSFIGVKMVDDISARAMAEMTERHPDYPTHISWIHRIGRLAGPSCSLIEKRYAVENNQER